MGKTLIIKGADFSANALPRVLRNLWKVTNFHRHCRFDLTYNVWKTDYPDTCWTNVAPVAEPTDLVFTPGSQNPAYAVWWARDNGNGNYILVSTVGTGISSAEPRTIQWPAGETGPLVLAIWISGPSGEVGFGEGDPEGTAGANAMTRDQLAACTLYPVVE